MLIFVKTVPSLSLSQQNLLFVVSCTKYNKHQIKNNLLKLNQVIKDLTQ